MKVVLLLVAIYALIINQSLKQVDSKQAVLIKKEKNSQPSGNKMYINAAFNSTTPVTEASIKQISIDKIRPAYPGNLFQPGNEAEQLKPQNLLYPVTYPYPANLDKRRS